jgi:hypothetical protein
MVEVSTRPKTSLLRKLKKKKCKNLRLKGKTILLENQRIKIRLSKK